MIGRKTMSKTRKKEQPPGEREIEKVDKDVADPKPGGRRTSAREEPEDRAETARQTTPAGKGRSK
jgi:hypothetical protein